MSIYTTLYITRTKALALYAERMGYISDRELEEFLDTLLAPSLYNAIVVEDDRPNDDKLI
jgi:hypothetical protein